MNIDVAKWVKQSRVKAGYTQIQLAEKLSMTKGNVSAFENGRTAPSFNIMIEICHICDVTLPLSDLKNIPQQIAVSIDELSIKSKYKPLEQSDYIKLNGGLYFSTRWLQDMAIDAECCYVAYVKGVSMYPTLQDGQAILIDTSKTRLIEDKIVLIDRDLNGLVIKRISRDKSGNWIYSSDNSDKNNFPNMFAFENDNIIGRVVWMGGNAGL